MREGCRKDVTCLLNRGRDSGHACFYLQGALCFPIVSPFADFLPDRFVQSVRGIFTLGDETAEFGGTDVDERGFREPDSGGQGRSLHRITGAGVDQDAMVA